MRQPLHVIYAGELATPVADSFVAFLEDRFASVRTWPIQELAAIEAEDADVLIVDGDGMGNSRHGQVTFATFPIPTVLIGGTGGKISDQLKLKTGWARGCLCLEDKAIIDDSAHPVFQGPSEVDLTTVDVATPEHFRQWTFQPLPEQISTVPILHKRDSRPELQRQALDALNAKDQSAYNDIASQLPWPGLVASGDGFTGPDTEYISGGINGKGPNYVAIGRHGPFLMWGFWGSPDYMTPAGKALFANCVTYIAKFRGTAVETLALTNPRDFLGTSLAFMHESDQFREHVLRESFGETPPPEVLGDRQACERWFEENRPYLRYMGVSYHDGHFLVDEDVKKLGVANFDVKVLDRAITEMARGHLEFGLRVFNRYTRQDVATAHEAATWLSEHRGHLFFSDSMGYRFISRLQPPSLRSDLGQIVSSAQMSEWMAEDRDEALVMASLTASRNGSTIDAVLQVHIAPMWHAYAPGSSEGIPLDVFLPPDSPFEFVKAPKIPTPDDGHLGGSFAIPFTLRGPADIVEVSLRHQLCDISTCRPPAVRNLASEVFVG